MNLPRTSKKVPKSSLLFLVPFLSLMYDAVCHVYSYLVYYFQTPSFVVFIIIPAIGALAVWRGGRIGYIIATVISLQFFLVEGPFGGLAVSAWSSVTVTDYFLIYITVVPALFLAFVFSVIGLKNAFVSKPLLPKSFPRTIPTSSFVVLLALGFIIGGTTIGMMAASTELGLGHRSSTSAADITIVQGASNSNNAEFYSPSTYTVNVGTTVTWVNDDKATHTVTSDTGLFDSGPMPPGSTFSYTFTKPGTYQYSCTYHPWMTGTIVVT